MVERRRNKSALSKRKTGSTDIPTSHFVFSFKKDWQTIPLALLAIAYIYILFTATPSFGSQITSSFSTLLMNLAFSALILATFSILYIFKVLRDGVVRNVARVVASILSLLFIAAVLYMTLGSGGQTCTGFFGVQTDCTSAHAVTAYILLLNPYSLLIWNVLAIIGVASLLTKFRVNTYN